MGLQELRHFSAAIGSDLRLVQAAGGNTSIKLGGTLWVKASGKWLVHADQEDVFVPVDLAGIQKGIAEGYDYLPEHTFSSGLRLRPSVETSMHALLPHAVVVHVHSVNTIAWAVRQDAEQQLASRLQGLRWCFVPYTHPGLNLTHAMQRIIQSQPADVVVLGNHGLVIAADSVAAAEALLYEVERRLALPERPAPQPDLPLLEQLGRDLQWRPAEPAWLHSVATQPERLAVATAGTLYPDHCVFLGPSIASMQPQESLTSAIERHQAQQHWTAPAMLVAGAGMLVSPTLSRSAQELLCCLGLVMLRVDCQAPVNYLRDEEVAALLNWDAEKYRQSLAPV